MNLIIKFTESSDKKSILVDLEEREREVEDEIEILDECDKYEKLKIRTIIENLRSWYEVDERY